MPNNHPLLGSRKKPWHLFKTKTPERARFVLRDWNRQFYFEDIPQSKTWCRKAGYCDHADLVAASDLGRALRWHPKEKWIMAASTDHEWNIVGYHPLMGHGGMPRRFDHAVRGYWSEGIVKLFGEQPMDELTIALAARDGFTWRAMNSTEFYQPKFWLMNAYMAVKNWHPPKDCTWIRLIVSFTGPHMHFANIMERKCRKNNIRFSLLMPDRLEEHFGKTWLDVRNRDR